MADYCIAGAGLSGMVLAVRLTGAGKTVLMVEKRSHIGGNCFDAPDGNGVLYHVYGPHYFRTNSEDVVRYLSRFTEWIPAVYQVRASARGKLWSFPVNLETFEQLTGRHATEEEFSAWLQEHRVPIANPKNSEEVILARVGRELYELFFEGYTIKQWKRHPRELDPSVCARIPVRTNRDSRYFSDAFQAMPKDGYTAMFERMREACGDRLELLLNTDFLTERPRLRFDRLVYTGPIDAYFDHCLGVLPWRSLRFELRRCTDGEFSGTAGFAQPCVQINYPDDHAYTRTVEAKHVTGQKTAHSNIVFEYPEEFSPGGEPYYPIPYADSAKRYEEYAALAAQEKDTLFIGRLANYAYLNMDQVVERALSVPLPGI